MSHGVAPWASPQPSTLLQRGFVVGILSGCVLGAGYGAVLGIVIALAEGGSVLIAVPGGMIGLAYGLVAGAAGSALVVPSVAFWLTMAPVQGQPTGWVRRRAQLLAVVVIAVGICITAITLGWWGEPLGFVIFYAIPGPIAMGTAAWIATGLVQGFDHWPWWRLTAEPSNTGPLPPL